MTDEPLPRSESGQGAWMRVQRWLERYAPSYRSALGEPAPETDLVAVEQAVGGPLPGDLRAWWTTVNGFPAPYHATGALIPEWYQPLSAAYALDTWRMLLDVSRAAYPAEMHADYDRFVVETSTQPAGALPRHDGALWLPQWLPVATSGAGGGLFVDLRGGPQRGCVLTHAKDGGPTGPVWPGIAAMWTAVADALESVDHEAFRRTGEHSIGHWRVPYG